MYFNTKKALVRYFKILEGRAKARFLLAKHSGRLTQLSAKAWSGLASCRLCEHGCGVNRLKGKRGFCGVGRQWRIFGAHTHWGEEPELVPSATLFESGCTIRCCYCQNAPASIEYGMGEIWSIQKVARWIEAMAGAGCRNINFVGGDPTPYIPHIIKSLGLVKTNVPVIFNSNAYYSRYAAGLLKNIVDVYLLDFRYWSEECSVRLSSAPGYPAAARRNLLAAKEAGEVIIRLLVMPNHIECDAKPILRWIARKLGPDTRVNILAQYRPCWRAEAYPEIARPLSRKEYEKVVRYAKDIGLTNLV